MGFTCENNLFSALLTHSASIQTKLIYSSHSRDSTRPNMKENRYMNTVCTGYYEKRYIYTVDDIYTFGKCNITKLEGSSLIFQMYGIRELINELHRIR